MIKPMKPSDIAKNNFVVCDIENNPDGSVLSIDTLWRENGEMVHIMHETWEQWIDWLVPKAKSDDKFRMIYAHNGGGWDWLSLAHYLLTTGRRKRQTITASTAASKMITMSVKIENKCTINFADSLQLLRSSLDKLGRKFCGRGKIDTGGLLPHEMERGKMLEYQRGDTELLLEVLERALDLIREHVAQIDCFGMTVGSTAMKVFKTIGITQPISIPWCPLQRAFFRQGYTGGRVEVFQYGEFDDVSVYDINSLYPYAMLTTDVPLSDRTAPMFELVPGSVGVVEIEWSQSNRDIIPILTQNGVGSYEGTGTYFTQELHTLKALDPEAKIIIKSGYRFLDIGKVFQDYVNRLYAVRLTDPDGPLSLLCKYLLNSLYGKFGQKTLREQILCFNSMEDIPDELLPEPGSETASKLTPINDEYGIFKVELERECKFEHIGIAGSITSAARSFLAKAIVAAGRKRVLYCDTDSVHMLGELPADFIGKKLGQFKLEFGPGRAVYCGKKLYALQSKNGEEKLRAKGVSIGGRNGTKLTFDGFRRMARGESIICDFKQPTTALQVFSLKNPCVFGDRKRTLKVTGNNA